MDAIAHKDVGRIPYCILINQKIGQELAEYYGVDNIYEFVDNSLEFIYNVIPMARMKEMGILQDGEYTDEWGVRWEDVGVTRGQVKIPPLKEPSLKGYRFPDQTSPEIIRAMKNQVEKSSVKYRLAKVGALWEQATFLRGMEHMLMDLISHPQFVHELLDRILEVLLADVQLYSNELDLDCMLLSDDYGSQRNLLMSPQKWREFIRPRLQRLCDAVHATGSRFALHSDGAIGAIIPDIVEIGVDVLNPVQSECVDAAWVKREYGKHITIWGGYGSQGTIVFGTPEQVRKEVNELCDLLGNGGGFILTPGLTIQDEVPVDNAAAFIDVAMEREKE